MSSDDPTTKKPPTWKLGTGDDLSPPEGLADSILQPTDPQLSSSRPPGDSLPRQELVRPMLPSNPKGPWPDTPPPPPPPAERRCPHCGHRGLSTEPRCPQCLHGFEPPLPERPILPGNPKGSWPDRPEPEPLRLERPILHGNPKGSLPGGSAGSRHLLALVLGGIAVVLLGVGLLVVLSFFVLGGMWAW